MLEIREVSWSAYEKILREMGERRNTRLAYSNEIIFMASPFPEHEFSKICISECVKVIFDELEMDYTSYGSITLKDERMQKAVEPDDCFYLDYADGMADKLRIDLQIDPPPELVLEVNLASKTQLEVYQALGVPELWRYEGGQLRIDALQGGRYVEQEKSPLLPGWPIKEAVEVYIKKARTTNQRKAKQNFRQWVIARIKRLQEEYAQALKALEADDQAVDASIAGDQGLDDQGLDNQVAEDQGMNGQGVNDPAMDNQVADALMEFFQYSEHSDSTTAVHESIQPYTSAKSFT
ncbi:MAG: Uma2 family endonuclease [Cyanobacteria bacterium P01_F01_bin.53]